MTVMEKDRTFVFLLAISCIMILSFATGAESGEPDQPASVKADAVDVHSEMSSTSKVVKTIRKGDTVIVEFEMEGPGGAWCGIIEEGQADISGYVPCNSLEREGTKTLWRAVGSKNITESTRPLPAGRTSSSPAGKKRPYSEVTVLLYMTSW